MKPLVVHQTDLFHSYNDPDDHWDLACQYALAFCGDIELGGILIDYPPMGFGDPAIQSVHQMNYITGLSVPVAIGISEPMKEGEEFTRPDGFTPGFSGIDMILRVMEQSGSKVVLHIVGSCRDIAIAASLKPELFKENCEAIYLNAGSSNPESKPEYNLALDPYSFSVVFGLECPIYWMPCFEYAPEQPEWRFMMGQYGTYYRFTQSEILPFLSEQVQKYFLYSLGKVTDNRWLSYLKYPIDERYLRFFCKSDRSMYSTAGFINAAGKTVTRYGEIVNLQECPTDPVFTFEPIELTCNVKGLVRWNTTDKAVNRYIFRINDLDSYPSAMTKAMKTLLSKLP